MDATEIKRSIKHIQKIIRSLWAGNKMDYYLRLSLLNLIDYILAKGLMVYKLKSRLNIFLDWLGFS